MTFNITDGLLISALGLGVTFVVLIALAIVMQIMGSVMRRSEAKPAAVTKEAVPTAAAADDTDTEIDLAILHCVLSQETGIPADQMVITSVTAK